VGKYNKTTDSPTPNTGIAPADPPIGPNLRSRHLKSSDPTGRTPPALGIGSEAEGGCLRKR